MLHHSPLARALAVGCAIVFVLSCVSTGLAQSGRRVRKSTPAPESTPEPTPTPTLNTSSEKPKSRLTFLLGLDRYDGFSHIPFHAYEGVLRSVAGRLTDDPTIHLGATQSDMGRSDAIKKAKAENEGYVVWLQLRLDPSRADNRNTGNLDDVVIEYTVFAPTTAKLVTSGRTYPRSLRNKGVVILDPRSSGIYGDRYLNQAAEEAADRILSHFRRHPPPGK